MYDESCRCDCNICLFSKSEDPVPILKLAQSKPMEVAWTLFSKERQRSTFKPMASWNISNENASSLVFKKSVNYSELLGISRPICGV